MRAAAPFTAAPQRKARIPQESVRKETSMPRRSTSFVQLAGWSN